MSDDEAIRLLVDYATNDEYAYGYRYRTRSSSARDRAPAVLAALRAQWKRNQHLASRTRSLGVFLGT